MSEPGVSDGMAPGRVQDTRAGAPGPCGRQAGRRGRQPERGGYRQIMAEVRAKVGSGAIPAGTPVPSITEQAARLRCARQTVGRAYRKLAADGVLLRAPGLGYYAAGTPGRARALPSPCRYQQVAAQVRGLITVGHLTPGSAVQVKVLARQHRCSLGTAARALGLLAGDGLLARNGTRSYHVTRPRRRTRQPDGGPHGRPPGTATAAGGGTP